MRSWHNKLLLPLGIAIAAGLLSKTCLSREDLGLNGLWEHQTVADLAYPPPAYWRPRTVPCYLRGHGDQKAWFRKTFVLPGTMQGMRIKLLFDAVKYDGKVYVNGQLVGGHLGGYEPFELDISGAVRFDQENELLVAVSDWAAIVSKEVDLSNPKPGEDTRKRVKNAALAPVGGMYQVFGICQEVALRSVPDLSIEDVFVMTSFREKKITARVRLRNEGMEQKIASLTNKILDGQETVLILPEGDVTLASGGSRDVEVEAEWPDPHLWSPSDPHLYRLETTLTPSSGPPDEVRTRFGFREFWCEGDSFFLNGAKVHLFGTAVWPPHSVLSVKEIRKALLDVRAANNTVLRLHTQPWERTWYDVADEVGLPIIEEGAVWSGANLYRLDDPTFWSNFSDHLSRTVRRDRNHPSILMWSIENELIYSGFGTVWPGTEGELAKLGTVVKELDPTRPILYEGDLDPGGVADVIGLHYPHEFPSYHLWPETAYWMDEPIALAYAPGGSWQWDRKKPLYLGEFLWVGGPFLYYDSYSILYGDEGYADPLLYRNKVREWTWQMQIEAYRDYGVSGICPYSIFRDMVVTMGTVDLKPDKNHLYQVQKAAFQPKAVFVKDCDSRFFVGERIERSVRVYNDSMERCYFTLKWSVGKAVQTKKVRLGPGERMPEVVFFDVPATPGEFALKIELAEGGDTVFSEEKLYSAYPRNILSSPRDGRLVLYDVEGTTEALFAQQGISYLPVADLLVAEYDSFDILVIGKDSLGKEGLSDAVSQDIAEKWQKFCNKGGWAVVLEQSWYPEWMPLGLSPTDYRANFAFPRAVAHPIICGLSARELRWWRGDNRVTAGVLPKPLGGNFRVLVDVGSEKGLDNAALIEIPQGSGGYICSQMLLATKFASEPVAGILLQRILDYCSTSKHRLRHAGLVAEEDSEAVKTLSRLGLLYENLIGRLPTRDLSAYPLLIIAGGGDAWSEAAACLERLVSYVDAGGKLLLHRPSEQFLLAAGPVLTPHLEAVPNVTLPIQRSMHHECGSSMSNYELYWVDAPGTWTAPPVLSKGIAERVYRVRDGSGTPPEGIVFLTNPGAMVCVSRGKGFIFLDEITWEREQKNRDKADRIISTILTDLGALLITPSNPGVEAAPEIVDLALGGQSESATLVWRAKPGGLYAVEYLSDLVGETWRLAGNVVGKGNVVSWVDDGAITLFPPGNNLVRYRYYRIEAFEGL